MLTVHWTRSLPLALVALLATLAAGASHADAIDWRLDMSGFGPIKTGMSPSQVSRIAGSEVVSDGHTAEDTCWYMRGEGRLRGVSIMVFDGKIARIEVDSPKFRTLSGAGIGNSLKQLEALYGARFHTRLTVEPHFYRKDSGYYLTLRSNDGLKGVRFEIVDDKVNRFYGGPWEYLLYVEGCS